MKVYVAAVIQPWGLDEHGLLVTTDQQEAQRQYASWVEEAAQKEEEEIEPHLFEYEIPVPLPRVEQQIHTVVGMFAGRIGQVIITLHEDVALAEVQLLRAEYGMPVDEALESEHDVQRVAVTLPLPHMVLSKVEVEQMASNTVSDMEWMLYHPAGEVCPQCGREFYSSGRLASLYPFPEDGLCPDCGVALITQSDQVQTIVQRDVARAIEIALNAVGSRVMRDKRAKPTPISPRLAALLAKYQREHNAYAKGREAQDWAGYDTKEAEADGQAQGLIQGLRHTLPLLRTDRWEFPEGLYLDYYIEKHEDDIGDVQVLDLEGASSMPAPPGVEPELLDRLPVRVRTQTGLAERVEAEATPSQVEVGDG